MSSGDKTAKDTASVDPTEKAPKERLPVRPAQAADTQSAGKGRFLAKNTVEDRKRGGNEPVAEPAPAKLASEPPEPEKPPVAGDEDSWGKDEESAGDETEDAADKKKSRKARKTAFANLWRTITGIRVPIIPAIALVTIVAALVALPVYQQGVASGRKQAEESIALGGIDIPPEVTAEVDGALMELRNGDPSKALATLQRIHEKQPRYPMVSYLVALAATQVGNMDLAEKCIAETLTKRERVSDALALRAVLESMRPGKPGMTMGDPKVRAENYLREAILADPANAAPRFELATLLRYSNRRDEARKEIRAAQARLNPVDAHTVMDVTLVLMDLEDKTDDDLPPAPAAARNLPEAFGGALIAMRKGDFPQAATLLEAAKAMSSFDIFHYLVNDPLLRRYKDQPEVAKFWQ